MKSGFLALLLLTSIGVRAQQIQLASNIQGTPQKTEFLPFADHLTVVFVHENAAEFIVLNQDFHPIFERTIYDLGLEPGATYLGISEEEAGWHLYFLSRGSFLGVRVSKAGDQQIVRMEGYGNANFSGSFSFNGTMHLLRLSAWENQLRLVKFRDGRQVYAETFQITTSDFVSRAEGEFVKMGESAHSMTDSFYPAKWYRFEDRLVFTLESPGMTEMVEVDLLTSVVHERQLPWSSMDGEAHSNTLCVGGYLIHANSLPDQFRMEIIDLNSDTQAYSCEVTSEGLKEGGTLIGWYGNRHQLLSEVEEGLVREDDYSRWLMSVYAHEHLGLSVTPSERGYSLEAGGISYEEVRGSTGMILDRMFQRDFLGLELLIPGDQDQMSAPLVFSSLRFPAPVVTGIWNGSRIGISRRPGGMIRMWQE